MSNRVRLTKRAADMSIPYPGNVNQPDRVDPDMEQYHTFEQQVNHELPDLRTEWKENPRDEIGFGVPDASVFPFGGRVAKGRPTMASVRVAASKAVRLAVLLLGEKVDEEVIEEQANDFMELDREALDRSLDRFAKTQKLYASEDEEEAAPVTVEKEAAAEAAPAPVTEEKEAAVKNAEDAPVGPNEQNDRAMQNWPAEAREAFLAMQKQMTAMAAKVASLVAADGEDEKTDDAEETTEACKASEDETVETESEVTAADDAEETDESVEEKSASDSDIELSGPIDDELEPDAIADEQLESLFDDESITGEAELDKAVEASSRKAGIKKLGGQPKVASRGGKVDLSSLWESAPDVNHLF